MRFSQETLTLLRGEPLAQGNTRVFREVFPLSGEWWDTIRLVFHHVVTIGSGDDAVVLGGYNWLKNVTLKTSKNEVPVYSPGHGLYLLNYWDNKQVPYYDAIVAANGEYVAVIDIPFSFNFLDYKDNLQFQSKLYSMLELELSCGTIADLYEAPGTASVVTTVDIILSRSKSAFLADQAKNQAKFAAMPYIRHYAPFNPATLPYLLFESAQDLAIFAILIKAFEDATPGVAYSGTPADILDRITFKDNVMSWLQSLPLAHFQADRQKGNMPLVGFYPYLFATDGSMVSAYGSAGKTEIRLEIGEVLGSPTDPQVDVLIVGMRSLR
jgi:hypothetical protein